jgi:hypothetical protein
MTNTSGTLHSSDFEDQKCLLFLTSILLSWAVLKLSTDCKSGTSSQDKEWWKIPHTFSFP